MRMRVFLLFSYLLSIACGAHFAPLRQAIDSLKQDYAYCDKQKKIKRSEIMQTEKNNTAYYEQYMSCKHLRRHRNRSHQTQCKKNKNRIKVRGFMSYGSRFSPYLGPYRYDVLVQRDKSVIQVRIHFESNILNDQIKQEDFPIEYIKQDGPMQTYFHLLDFYLMKASSLWTQHSPIKNLVFEFVRVRNKKSAHFSVKYTQEELKSVVYNKKWSTKAKELIYRNPNDRWFERTFSHEIGHMLGLEDEYNRIRGMLSAGYFVYKDGYGLDCSAASLMCTYSVGWTTKTPTHYLITTILFLNESSVVFNYRLLTVPEPVRIW